ncbi:g3771 [Coccomyxa elongata]
MGKLKGQSWSSNSSQKKMRLCISMAGLLLGYIASLSVVGVSAQGLAAFQGGRSPYDVLLPATKAELKEERFVREADESSLRASVQALATRLATDEAENGKGSGPTGPGGTPGLPGTPGKDGFTGPTGPTGAQGTPS